MQTRQHQPKVTQMERQGWAGGDAAQEPHRDRPPADGAPPASPGLQTLTLAPAWPGEGVREQPLLPPHSGRQLAPWCCRGQEPGKKYHIIKMTNPFTN